MKIIKICILLALVCGLHITASAQQYVSPMQPAKTGRSPGVKVKLLSQNGDVKTYVLVFAKNDEVISGLTEFAQKYNVTAAHFKGMGDAMSAKVAWYEQSKKMFKVIPIAKPAEITSIIGNITINQGKPVVHAHINLADENGMVHGGHLLEAFIFPTLEVFVTVEPTTLNKKIYTEAGAFVIDADK
jgi:predicted DNA-binding protein with PD1-like motif